MKKVIALMAASSVAVFAGQVSAQCATCAGGSPTFSQPAAAAAPAPVYSAPVQSYGAPVEYESAPMVSDIVYPAASGCVGCSGSVEYPMEVASSGTSCCGCGSACGSSVGSSVGQTIWVDGLQGTVISETVVEDSTVEGTVVGSDSGSDEDASHSSPQPDGEEDAVVPPMPTEESEATPTEETGDDA